VGPAHLAVGLVARPLAPKAPLGAILLATELTDILWGVFTLARLDGVGFAPWSHGLLTSAIWSGLAGLASGRVYRDKRTGAVIGLLVFSHWVLDFISHPMQPNTAPDLPLAFAGSPKVGLGLYGALGRRAAAVELGLLVLGIATYLVTRRRTIVPVRG